MSLPVHGWVACRRCFTAPAPLLEIGPWRAVNDPGAWGSATPKVLVLGFSKGFTQANASRSERFEDIPFKGMRVRLTETLRVTGVLGPFETVDQKMVSTEREMAFGSLVGCSLSRRSKNGRFECTGPIMAKAFLEEVAPMVRRCAEIFLTKLPPSMRLILMLGTGDAYIARCRALIRSLFDPNFEVINDVSYRAGDAVWVHISHPSGLNGHHPAWMSGNPRDKQGRKRLLAMEAIELSRREPARKA